jgi:S1-C subfamily serine protease
MSLRLLFAIFICATLGGVHAREKDGSSVRASLPRAPQVGQAFDDGELDAFFDRESLKLATASKLGPLKFHRRNCNTTLPAPATEKLAWPVIAQRAEASTVVLGEIYREGRSRTNQFSVAAGGFVIAPEGVILSCLHVATEKGTRGLTALLRDGRVFAIREVLASDPTNDLAVFQLDVPPGTELAALPLAAEAAPIAEPIGVMSHPQEHFWMWTTGTVARQTMVRDKSGDQHFTTITADFAKGSSGCPVLDERGNAIGVVNNTESIYYENDGRRRQVDLQMVVRNVTPSWVVRRMFVPAN